MITLRPSTARGTANLGWLNSKHSFSFGHYYNPTQMGFASLRVINDDRVAPGAGFGTHPHQNMEIISYVLEGALEHKDSMGNGSVIRPGDVQRLSAGTGMTHSEYNHSSKEDVHFLQIWFIPDTQNIQPSYAQQAFTEAEKRGKFRLVASKNGREGSVSLRQDVDISVALIDGEEMVHYHPKKDRQLWGHIARGEVTLNGQVLRAGDGVAIEEETELLFEKGQQAEVIVLDMRPV
ncbi:MAG: pirin family protein [Cellvibrionaceae bacterium]|nr:pirin family protein [Cellvibrionaceae bacterium]